MLPPQPPDNPDSARRGSERALFPRRSRLHSPPAGLRSSANLPRDIGGGCRGEVKVWKPSNLFPKASSIN